MTMTIAALAQLADAYGSEWAPPADECIIAAREGNLWLVDTQRDGADALIVAASAADALDEIAAYYSLDEWAALGGAALAASRRWSASRICLAD